MAFNTMDYYGAAELLSASVDQYPMAGLALGEMYRCGFAVRQDDYEAIYWFRRYVRPSDTLPGLQKLLAKHPNFPTEDGEVFAFYKKLVDENATVGNLYRLGMMYKTGRGTPKDPTQAFLNLTLAAGMQHDFAQLEMARHHFDVENDLPGARIWMAAAAEAGNPIAQHFHADFIVGIDKDPKTAVLWYLKAAQQNYGKAAGVLGTMMVAGAGIEKDRIEGAKWLKLSLNRVAPSYERTFLDVLRPLWNFFTEAERAEVDKRMGAFIDQMKAKNSQRSCGG